MTYQTTNYFDVTRQDGTHTAANEELVVSDGGTITPPTPTTGETFGVRALRNDVTLVPNNSFEGSTNDRRIDAEGNAVFVSDGTEWYLVSGEEHFGFDIPDSVIQQLTAKNYDETTTWIADAGNDMSLSSSLSKTTASDGSEAVDFTSSVTGSYTIPSGFSLNSFTYETSFQGISGETGTVRLTNSSGSRRFSVEHNDDDNSEPGLTFSIYDKDGTREDVTIDFVDSGTGNRIDVTFVANDVSNGNYEAYINGSSRSVIRRFNTTPNNFGGETLTLNQNPRGEVGGLVLAQRLHDRAIDSPTITNYPF